MSQSEPIDEDPEDDPDDTESDGTGADPEQTNEDTTNAPETETGDGSDDDNTGAERSDESTENEVAVDSPVEGTQFVDVEDVGEQLERRIGNTGYKSKMANIIEELPEKFVKRERRGEGYVIKLRTDGLSKVLNQNTGSAGSGGGDTHRYVLKRTFQTLTAAGFMVELPEQEGANQPDGIAELPVDLSSESYPEMRAKMGELEEQWPDAHHLSNGQDIYVEAETSTTTKPQQTLSNLKKAYDAGRRCIFVFQDTYNPDKGNDMVERARDAVRILTDPPAVAYQDQQSRRFYNQSDRLEVDDDHYAIRARTETGSSNVNTYWWERSDGTVALTDSSSPGGTPFAQFNSLQSVIDPDPGEVPAYYTYDHAENEYVVTDNQGEGTANRTIYTDKEKFKDEWAKIYPPFIPEKEFGGRLPTHEDWTCIIFPNDDNDIPPLEYIYSGTNTNGEKQTQLHPVLAKDRAEFDPTDLYKYINHTDEIPVTEDCSSTGSESDEGTDGSDETESETTTESRADDGTGVESTPEKEEEPDREPEQDNSESDNSEPEENSEDEDEVETVSAEFDSHPSFEFDRDKITVGSENTDEADDGDEHEIAGPGTTSTPENEKETQQPADPDARSDKGEGATDTPTSGIKSGGWYLIEGMAEEHLLAPENKDLNDTLPLGQADRESVALCGREYPATPEDIDNPFDHTDNICQQCEQNLRRRAGGSNEIAEVLQQYREEADTENGTPLNTPSEAPHPDGED